MGGQDGAEELGREELVGRVGGGIDGRVNKVALGRVILAANDELEILVVLGLINSARQLLEGSLVDDGAHEVAVLLGRANLELLNLGNKRLLELSPLGLWHIDTRGSAALLALVLKGTTDSLLGGVVDVGRGVNQMEVLSSSLSDHAGVASVSTVGDALADGAVELAEDGGAAGVVKGSKLLVLEDDLGDLNGVTRNELDNVLGEAGLKEDLVDEPVGSNSEITGLPDNDVAEQSRGTRQVTSNGSEVEGAHGVDETLERSVLETVPDTRRVMLGLGVVELLSIVNVEAEEVSQLGGRVDLGLPGVLALAEHGGGHNLIAVLCRDEVGGLEKDGGAVGKGERLPGWLGGESSIDGGRDVSVGGGVVRCDGCGVVSRIDLLGGGR